MPDFDVGKYGPYVWPAFIVTALVFAWMIGDSLWRARAWRRSAPSALQAGGLAPARARLCVARTIGRGFEAFALPPPYQYFISHCMILIRYWAFKAGRRF